MLSPSPPAPNPSQDQQLWFLVGPPRQQVEGSACHSSNKGSKTKASRSSVGADSQGAKNKTHTFPLIDPSSCGGAWPQGSGEERAQISCPAQLPPPPNTHMLPPPARGAGTLIPSAQRLVWAKTQVPTLWPSDVKN